MVRTIVVYVLHINDHMNVYLTYFHMKRVYLFNIILNCERLERLFTSAIFHRRLGKQLWLWSNQRWAVDQLCHATRLDWLLISWPSCRWWTVTATGPMSVWRPIRIQHAIGSRVLIGCSASGPRQSRLGWSKPAGDVTSPLFEMLGLIFYLLLFTAFGTKVNFCHSMYF